MCFPGLSNVLPPYFSATAASLVGASSLHSGMVIPCPSHQSAAAGLSTSIICEPEISIHRLYTCDSNAGGGGSGFHSGSGFSQLAFDPIRNHSKNQSCVGAVVIPARHASSSSGSSSVSQCEYCNFSCSWKYDLKLHLKQKHGIYRKNI